METTGEERDRIVSTLNSIDQVKCLLDSAAKENSTRLIKTEMPSQVMALLAQLSALNVRDDAEHLLASGVSMWNSVIALDKCTGDDASIALAILRLRHVACDTMMIGASMLDHVSSTYCIDELSLIKFYTTCGGKYLDISEFNSAESCYSKATELQQAVLAKGSDPEGDTRGFQKAFFDLLVGKSQSAWAMGLVEDAQKLVTDAGQYLVNLPEEASYLANIEYNFGLHSFEDENKENALEWLLKSLETRKVGPVVKVDKVKQAITMRLAGICFLSLDKVDEARNILTAAEELHHDSVGAYILLKIAIIDRSSDVPELLNGILSDPESSESTLELAMSAIGLMTDSDKLQGAVDAYKTIWYSNRFSDDLIAEKVAPRYFEALTAIGATSDALTLLDEVFNILEKLPRVSPGNDDAVYARTTDPDHNQRWSVIALQAGCGFANRKDYHSATVLLDRALRISEKDKTDNLGKALYLESNHRGTVIENEVASCRLLAFCAISYVKSLNPEEAEGVGAPSLTRKDALDKAKTSVSRALNLDPDDFSTRLLLFRIRLLENQPEIAAAEIQKASSETVYFDALGLAEAAIYAGEANENAAVLASLRCILDVNVEEMRKSLVESEKKPQDGFLGTVFVAYMKLKMKETNQERSGQDENKFSIPGELLVDFHDIMRIGYRFMQELGVEVVFGKDADTKETALKFLGALAWNCGRQSSVCKMYDLWASFFDMCHDFHMHSVQNEDSDKSMLISRMMAGTALLFAEPQESKDYNKAKERLSEAKRLCEEQNILGEDPLAAKIALLQAKCFVGMGDDDSLAVLVDVTSRDTQMSTDVLVDLALLCRDGENFGVTSGSFSKARRNEMCCTLLNVCVDRMLAKSDADIAHIAHVLRELILSEIGRGEAGNKTTEAFMRATGLLKEKGEEYPRDERRWLVGIAWDRSEMLMIANRLDEALVWVKMGIEVASPDNGLATYVPKLEKLKEKLLKASEEENSTVKTKEETEKC